MARLRVHNPIAQALLLGVALFLASVLFRVGANMLVGHATAGPTGPAAAPHADGLQALFFSAIVMGVLLPAFIETPLVVYPVRRTNLERPSVALWVVIAFIFGVAWLVHGASPGALGQAVAFAFLAYASWGWSRRLGRPAYWLAILTHAAWNSVAAAIFIARHFSSSHAHVAP